MRLVCLGIEQGVVTGRRGGGGGGIERCKLPNQNHMTFDLAFDMRLNIMRVLNAQVRCVCMYVCIFVYMRIKSMSYSV